MVFMPYSDYLPLYKQYPKWPKQAEALKFVKQHAETGCGLLLEMGCLDGDALISINRGGIGKKISLREAYLHSNGLAKNSSHNWDNNIETYCRALCGDEFHLHKLIRIVSKGVRSVVLVTLASGRTLRLTPDHEILQLGNIWTPAEELQPGDLVVGNGQEICSVCRKPENDTVVSVVSDGMTDVYDIEMADPYHNFVANGIVVHNCGKSRIIVEYLQWLFARSESPIVCIVAPLTVLHVWTTAWEEWSKYPAAFINLHDAGSAGIREAQALSAEGWPVICLVNYETAKVLGYKMITRTKRDGTEITEKKKVDTGLEDVNWTVMVLDESTEIKNRGSATSKFFRLKMREKVQCRILLSGSAYTKRPLDVWAQIKFITGQDTFEGNFEIFAAEYGIPHPSIRGAFIGYKNIDRLVEKLDSCCVMLKKTDMGVLPPVIHSNRFATLCPKSKELYQQIKEEMYAEFETINNEIIDTDVRRLMKALDANIDDRSSRETIQDSIKLLNKAISKIDDAEMRQSCSVTADHVFSRMRKWSQITSGFIIPDHEPGEIVEPIMLGTEKVDALMTTLEDRNGEPTVIVVQQDPEEGIISRAIAKKFGFIPPLLNGSVNASKRGQMVKDAAKWPFFIVKESVACKGIDMRWTDTILFYSHRYHTVDYEQMLARNHRGGVTHERITYGHFLVKGTIDTDIYRALTKDLATKSSIEIAWRTLHV
jgi:hypothetical protein